MAADDEGNALRWNGVNWTEPVVLVPYRGVVAESCPSATFCMASVDLGGGLFWPISATVPAAPKLAATAGNGKVTLAWHSPSNDGGATITGFNLYRSTTKGALGTEVQKDLDSTTYTDSSVTNGTTYYYEAAAVNSVGEGELSAQVAATPTSLPPSQVSLLAFPFSTQPNSMYFTAAVNTVPVKGTPCNTGLQPPAQCIPNPCPVNSGQCPPPGGNNGHTPGTPAYPITSGTVTFTANGYGICQAVSLPAGANGGTASCLTSFVDGGYAVVAHFSGNSSFAPSATAPVLLQFGPCAPNCSFGNNTSLPTAVVSEGAVFTSSGLELSATVVEGKPAKGAFTPYVGVGELTFLANGEPIPSCSNIQVTGEPVDCLWQDAPPGTYTIVAKYLGYASFSNGPFLYAPSQYGSNPPIDIEVAGQAANVSTSITNFGMGPDDSGGEAFDATVIPSAGGERVTAGTLEFVGTLGSATKVLCGPVSLSSGSAYCTSDLSGVSAGNWNVVASYLGGAANGVTYEKSQSTSIELTVTGAATIVPTVVSIGAIPDSSGTGVELTGFVVPQAGGQEITAGTISFLEDNAGIPGCTGLSLSSGSVSCDWVNPAPGSYGVVGSYSGATSSGISYQASVSANLPLIINGFDPPAPPSPPTAPAGSTNSASGAVGDRILSVSAVNANTSVEASGVGAFTVAQYSPNPESVSPSLVPTGSYFDVQTASGSSLTGLTITDCNLNGGNELEFWNGNFWQLVSSQTFSAGPPGCVTATLTSTSLPTVTSVVAPAGGGGGVGGEGEKAVVR